MTEKKVTKQAEVKMYVAEDGTEFENKYDCEKYEAELFLKKSAQPITSMELPSTENISEDTMGFIAKIENIESFTNLIKYVSLTYRRLNIDYVVEKNYKKEFDGKTVVLMLSDIFCSDIYVRCETLDWLKEEIRAQKCTLDEKLKELDENNETDVPHIGYWKNRADKNDFLWCECSNCGFMIENYVAVITGKSDRDYIGVKYNFCPKCGARMKANKEPKN